MKKQEIVTIANELMSCPSKTQKDILLNTLVGHKSIKRLTEPRIALQYRLSEKRLNGTDRK